MNNEEKSKPEEHNMLSDMLHNIDTNFPLSGGETDDDLEEAIESLEDDITPSGDTDDFADREHLDTNFPLSGGTQ